MKIIAGWEYKRLIDLAAYINGYAFKPVDWGKEGLPIIRIEQLKNPEVINDYFSGYVPEKNIINNGDLIFSWSASLFLEIWKHGKAILNQHLFKVIEKSGIDRLFLKQFIEFYLPEISKLSHGSTMKHITRKELECFGAQVPSFESEQSKIAEILSTMDQAIEQTEALITKQQRIKVGLMQDLLTRGIDEHGNIRSEQTHKFKDSPVGRIPVEWKVNNLGEVSRISSGLTPLRSNYRYWQEGTIPWVKTSEIIFNEITCTGEFITEEALMKTAIKIMPKDTVLVAMYGQGGTRGRVALLKVETTTNQACASILGRKEELNQRFLFYYLTSQYNELRSIGHGSNQVNLSGKILNEFPIKLPKYHEQLKIAEVIYSVEKRTIILEKSLGKLRSLKTALMQDLLTGKKRVTPLL
jgi:type I restriction enzyme S subunit